MTTCLHIEVTIDARPPIGWRILAILFRSLPSTCTYTSKAISHGICARTLCDATQWEGTSRTMSIRVWACLLLAITAPSITWAQRPVTYPLRSQSVSQQSVDEAYCYWQAKQQTGVDITRQPQRPTRSPRVGAALDVGSGTAAPPLPHGADVIGAASAADASAVLVASGAQLPPLPHPEPPMTVYWHAFGDCMQSRGYGVH